jgi:hypothetical protein
MELVPGALEISGDLQDENWLINIMYIKEGWDDKVYNITLMCPGYKPSVEAVWFDLEGEDSFSWHIEISEPSSNLSMTIDFTPVEESEEQPE